MRVMLRSLMALGFIASCSSQPIEDNPGAAGGGNAAAGSANATGGNPNANAPSNCSAALRQSLSLVDEVSTAAVSITRDEAGERQLYVDASVGGLAGQDTKPWVYVALATGQAVALTDLEALKSKEWDLAFKRSMVRTNGGDSGPGQGGALRIALPWDAVDASTLGKKKLPVEDWFDANCVINLDSTMNLITTFSGWSSYDQVRHILSATPNVVFIAAGGDGALYKVAILDYASTPTGAPGKVSGHYALRVAPLL